MKRTFVLMALLLSVQANAFDMSKEVVGQPKVEEKKSSGGSSASLYSDVECDMSDYTCSKIIIDLGRQEALAYIMANDGSEASAVLKQAIQVYRNANLETADLSDDEVIYLLATE